MSKQGFAVSCNKALTCSKFEAPQCNKARVELETACEFFRRRAAQAQAAIGAQSNKLIAKEMQRAVKDDEKQLAEIEK